MEKQEKNKLEGIILKLAVEKDNLIRDLKKSEDARISLLSRCLEYSKLYKFAAQYFRISRKYFNFHTVADFEKLQRVGKELEEQINKIEKIIQ